ncbi:MAG: hypothetical protein HDR12_08605 [Lachnospiraceae bacterium]|nr:hypothetical protein [Lachnospiraceae bacterium]
MSKIKKIAALSLIAVIVAASLTGCGNYDTEDISDVSSTTDAPDASEITEDIAESKLHETADETIPVPETYEDYMKLAAACYENEDWEIAHDCYYAAKELDGSRVEVYRGLSDTYLQMGDVIQALDVLDEGMEKCGDKHSIDLISQRKEYLLAGMVTIRVELAKREYDDEGEILSSRILERDENGNEIKEICNDTERESSYVIEYQYDADGNITEYKCISYDSDGNSSISSHWTWAYDEDGNETEFVIYDSDGNVESRIEYEYDEDENENKNMAEYTHIEYDEEKGIDSCVSERKYDADGRETAFYLYDNETTVYYQSSKEYDENGRIVKYTGCDNNGTVLVRKETEYDESGKVIRVNYYGADDNLTQYYENEYDDFGSITRQTMYEDGILKAEKQMNYLYRYIGNIDDEVVNYMDNDVTTEEYNLKQRAIFTKFLNGQEKARYYSKEDNIDDGEIVSVAITNLINFAYCRQNKEFPEYTFLDMTGDGVEELIINCGRKFYVIQSNYGVLKVIFSTVEYDKSYLVKGNGRTGICVSFSGHMSTNKAYYFLDENGKNNISLDVFWDSDGKMYYRSYDNNCFEWHYISEGEYYDIMSGMAAKTDIDWYKLEEPDYGND